VNILYASTIYPPAIGGAQLHLHRLASQMQGLGHRVRVATHTSRYRRDWVRLSTIGCETPLDYTHEGVDISRLGFSPLCRLKMAPWALAYYALMGTAVERLSQPIGRSLERLPISPDLVHATRIGREFLPRAALDLARRRQVPFVLTPNHHPRWRGWLYREYDKLYRAADAVIALTDAEKDLLVRQKHVRPERIHVTGIGPVLAEDYSVEAFRRRHGLPGRFVLWLGQQLPYKGLAAVVEAAPAVWRNHPDVTFVFIGPATRFSRRLFARVRDRRLVNLASVDLETKTAALGACDMLCLPSMQESFGGVYVEAWSHRKAVIGGRTDQIAGVVEHGVDGLLARQTPDEIAAAINRLLADPDECRAMGESGWRKVHERFTWERLAAQTLDIYRLAGAAMGACPATAGEAVAGPPLAAGICGECA
jgi:glycosyltransferase involved in cell wall biosynthesis